MRRPRDLAAHCFCLASLIALPVAGAQDAATPPAPPPDTSTHLLSSSQQIAAAVLPLPAAMRDSATVLGYTEGKLGTLRAGSGAMICLAPPPKAPRFHVACYHRSLSPFMARGRALRARGMSQEKIDSVRFREARRGRLALPKQPASLYSLTGPWTTFDSATVTATGARPLFVVYIPYATPRSTGLSAVPVKNGPWIMSPGTPKAHIMFVPEM